MSEKIKINKDLKFDYWDLMQMVDQDCEFTLMDVLEACKNSKIPMKILTQILQCLHIPDYYKEAKSRKYRNHGDIDYLRLFLWGSIDTYGGKLNQEWGWAFDGIGKPGHYGKDIEQYIPKKDRKTYIQGYAIEFSPMYTLSGLKIKVDPQIHITDHRTKDVNKMDIRYDFKPSINLAELLYSIFWELSFCGGIKSRDNKKKSLNDSVRKIKKAIKDDNIDKITVPWEKVKKDMEKKLEEMKKEKENGVQLREKEKGV